MISWLRDWVVWGWTELTKPRGHVGHRFYRVGRSSRSGVAMLLTVTTLLFMTVLVAEIQYAATVRLKLAAHQRDEAKAEVLAKSGVYMYQLVLVASKQVKGQMQQLSGLAGGMPGLGGITDMLGSMELWEFIPFVNTGLMRMVFVSGGDLDNLDNADDDGGMLSGLFSGGGTATGGAALSDEEREKSRDTKSSRAKSFLDFDGDFFVEVTDEDRRINVRQFRKSSTLADLQTDITARRLRALMSGFNQCDGITENITNMPLTAVEYVPRGLERTPQDNAGNFFRSRDLDPWELIGNLADWTDADDMRVFDGGQEDSLYDKLDSPYRAKNAGFDSVEEIRLVDGWHDDDIWERFGKNLTVYGSGRVNVNTAECEVLEGLLYGYVTQANGAALDPNSIEFILGNMQFQKNMWGARYSNPQQFVQAVTQLAEKRGAIVDPQLGQVVGTEATVFRIHSVGEVGDASVTIDAILDFSSNATGKVVYWRVQ